MGSRCDDENTIGKQQESKRRPLYTVRQPPLIQPLRLSPFIEKTCSRFDIPPDDLANEWVVLFQAISGGGRMGEGMPLQIPDTVLLSPSGYVVEGSSHKQFLKKLIERRQPSVWYTTSAAGRVKAKDLMRVSPQAILEAFQTPLRHRRNPTVCMDDLVAVRRLGFEVNTLFPQQLQVFCRDMTFPTICLPTELTPQNNSNSVQSGLTKGVFCLQRYIPCQNNASFLVVWRHSHVRDNCEKATSPVPGECGSTQKSTGASKRLTPRAHSDVFLLTLVAVDVERGANDNIEDSVSENETAHALMQSDRRLAHLDIESPDNCTAKALRQSGFDVGVMAPLLFYMKRVTSEIANCINLGRNTRQACGLACEFFVGEHNRSVYFSALRGIQWVTGAPSWDVLRDIDPLSRSLCEFYESSGTAGSRPGESTSRRRNAMSPLRPQSPLAAMYYEQNPRFPSVHTPFAGEKQWLHRSQLLAPDVSPRYIGASVPRIYRDGVFQSLLTAHQADSVVRLNLSPQAPASLSEVRREQPHLSPRSISIRRRTTKSISVPSNKNVDTSTSPSSPSSSAV